MWYIKDKVVCWSWCFDIEFTKVEIISITVQICWKQHCGVHTWCVPLHGKVSLLRTKYMTCKYNISWSGVSAGKSLIEICLYYVHFVFPQIGLPIWFVFPTLWIITPPPSPTQFVQPSNTKKCHECIMTCKQMKCLRSVRIWVHYDIKRGNVQVRALHISGHAAVKRVAVWFCLKWMAYCFCANCDVREKKVVYRNSAVILSYVINCCNSFVCLCCIKSS